jgi:hypothetical protein
MRECETCQGSGWVEYGEFGFDCAAMHNGGRIPDAPGRSRCDNCQGKGVVATKEEQREDVIYDALSTLSGVETHDMDLRNHPDAWATMEALCTHVYAEGRKDEREDWAGRIGPALDDIATERLRQIEAEGWTTAHDDEHSNGELIDAAVSYALGNPERWPWSVEWWKPKDQRRNLVRAAALMIAEIDRLDRAKYFGGCSEGAARLD